MERGTIVVLPSATFPVAELRKITGILHYEERMLFTVLLLRRPDLRLVYVTSMPVDEAIVEYYLSFLPDPADARRRLDLVAVGDAGPRPLTEKLLDHSEVVARLRRLAGDPDQAYVLPFNVTPAELRLADSLGLPTYGPHPDAVWLGSKTGSRMVARRAGVPVLVGTEDVRSLDELEAAVSDVRARSPEAEAVVIKLNDGFSGQGNAIVDLNGLASTLPASPTTFCGAGESWPSFLAKLGREGAVVEELVRTDGMASPSVQLRITPSGAHEVLSTHDQILSSPENQVYLGCRFPAHPDYRLAIQEAGTRVAEVLAAHGVIGSFGIDFLVVPLGGSFEVYLSEINLRMGGTTHPFWMTRLATEGTYDASTGELRAEGTAKCYVATDNLKSRSLAGLAPAELIASIERAGLGYDRHSRTGATLHLLGAMRHYGKMGVTCIADSPEGSEELYRSVVGAVDALGG